MPVSEVARVLCDSAITRVVIDAHGLPLDVGRTQRLFTGELRRAVIARDRECVWPGCHIPARWCEIHHVRWWTRDGGPTSVDNGALLCVFHHQETHDRDLTITRVVVTHGHSPGRSRGRPPAGAGTGRTRRRGPTASIALVIYEFRDPTGRLIGSAPHADTAGPQPGPMPTPGTARCGQVIDDPSTDRPGRPGAPPATGPERAAGDDLRLTRATDPPGRSVAQVDELTWTTDPMTGVRVPTLWADP